MNEQLTLPVPVYNLDGHTVTPVGSADVTEIERLRAALRPFGRIWALSEADIPQPQDSIAGYVARLWPTVLPTMADAKLAYDLTRDA